MDKIYIMVLIMKVMEVKINIMEQKVNIRAELLEFGDPLMKNRQLNMKTSAAIWKLMAELNIFTLLYPLLKIR
jgi:hypothetical protein